MVNIASAVEALREDTFDEFWSGFSAQERTESATGEGNEPAPVGLICSAGGHPVVGGRWACACRGDLHSACALCDTRLAEEIIKNNPAALNAQIDTYYPIQYALGHPEVIRLLSSHGDDPNCPIEKLAWFEWEDGAAKRKLLERESMMRT